MNNRSASYKIFSLPIPIPGHEAVSYLYLVRSRRTALIDTGPASTLPLLTAALAELGIPLNEIDYILGTHIHLDHLGGLSQSLKLMPNATVIVHPRGIPHLADPIRLWQASLAMSGQNALDYGQPEPVPPEKLIAAQNGQYIDLGGISLKTLFTPGHAPHHISFFDRENGNLFAGESAGIYFPDTGLILPAAPPPFDLRQSLDSLDKMLALQPQTIFYCHYGSAPDAIARLNDFRRRLVLWADTVAAFFDPHLELSDELVTKIVAAINDRDGPEPQFAAYSADRLKSEPYFLRNNVRGFWTYFQRQSNPSLI